jgi:hypothetical protein
LLFESGLIEQQEAARILECHRNTVYLNVVFFLLLGGFGVLVGGMGE